MRGHPAANVAAQAFVLRACYPTSTLKLGRGALRWQGELTPSPLSATYKVQLAYRQGEHPEVRVERPRLEGRKGEALPHTYEDGSLCLYRDGEWSGRMLIAHTIVPWSSEWLYYYELWLPGGDWYGGGEWPPVRAPESPSAPRARGELTERVRRYGQSDS